MVKADSEFGQIKLLEKINVEAFYNERIWLRKTIVAGCSEVHRNAGNIVME